MAASGTLAYFLTFSYAFTALEFDSNYISILLWKIVKQRNHNEIKDTLRAYFYFILFYLFIYSLYLPSITILVTYTN